MELRDVTIVGGGPCGLFAAFYAGMRGMSVRIVDSLGELGGQLAALYPEKYVYDMPGFAKITAKALARELVLQAAQFEPELALGEAAETLSQTPEGWEIGTASGAVYPSRTVVIAAGAGAFTPTKLGVPREDEFHGRGLSYGVRDKGALAGKRLAVLGGGDSAVDWCLNLEDVAGEITLIHRRDGFRAHEDSLRRMREGTTRLKLPYTVVALHGNGELGGLTLQHAATKETERFDCDALIVNIGFKSSLGPIKGWGLELEKGQIKVDERFETNRRGVFAIGDVCTFPSKLKLIATGVGEAATAICFAKTRLDPAAKLFPGHSSDMDLPAGA